MQEAIKIAHLMLQARVRVVPPGAVEAATPSLGPAGVMQPNGTRFGGWLLNTADNAF